MNKLKKLFSTISLIFDEYFKGFIPLEQCVFAPNLGATKKSAKELLTFPTRSVLRLFQRYKHIQPSN
jgi:hypothetical protein